MFVVEHYKPPRHLGQLCHHLDRVNSASVWLEDLQRFHVERFWLGFSRVKRGDATKLFPKFALFLARFRWDLDVDNHVQVPLAPGGVYGQTAAAYTQLPALGCAGRDAHRHPILERRHNHFRTQYGFPRRQVESVIEIGAAYSELRMCSEPHPQIQVAGRTSADTVLTHAGNPDGLTLVHASRNPNLKSL